VVGACESPSNSVTPTLSSKENQQANILAYAFHMKQMGRADSTIETAVKRLNRLTKLCNINEPEQVKTVLATLNWTNNSKHNVTGILSCYYQFHKIQWEAPEYKRERNIPFIPTEEELDALINGASRRMSTLLLLKETGARIGEILKTKWTDLDTQRRTITITPEEGSNGRILPLSTQLIDMLNHLPRRTDTIFTTKHHGARTSFEALRKRIAAKLQNPRLNKIHFHTFRHYKATMEYHKTKDIIHVKQILGHRCIESTMTYINIEQALFLADSDEWTCRTASNLKEAQELIESGFEYITDMEGHKLFRKRK
jgi:integrase/recombinase XerD